jgi:hypothetical protein
MTCVLHGGEKLVLLKDKFMQEIERDPAFRLDDIHDLTKDQVCVFIFSDSIESSCELIYIYLLAWLLDKRKNDGQVC